MRFYRIVCAGIGQIGRPIFELLRGAYGNAVYPIDPVVYPKNISENVRTDFLHICIPGNLSNFKNIFFKYVVDMFPRHVIIHSTVVPGTTTFLHDRCKKFDVKCNIFHSPVNGKHHNNQMKRDLLFYTKMLGYIPGTDSVYIDEVKQHLERAGFKVRCVEKPETTEWSKILSTTYFGMIIAFHQEIERISEKYNINFDETIKIFTELKDIVPPHYSGVIGGHCVMPNIELMEQVYKSKLLDWIKESNLLKIGATDETVDLS